MPDFRSDLQLFLGLRKISFIRVVQAEEIPRDLAFLLAAVFGRDVSQFLDDSLVFFLLRRERLDELAALPDAGFEGLHCIPQRFLPDIMLMVHVPVAAHGKEKNDQRHCAPLDYLFAVLRCVLDAMAHLVYKLVVLQLSTMCSIHKNLGKLLWYQEPADLSYRR